MAKKRTKKQQRLDLFNIVLTRSKSRFNAGAVLSANELAALFYQKVPNRKGSYEAVHAENMRMLRLQRDLNSLLAKSGLYLRSSMYYKYFTVCDKKQTKAKIERMSASIDRITDRTTELEEGLKTRSNRGNWGTYNKLQQLDIDETLEVPTSTRHERLVKRLGHIK